MKLWYIRNVDIFDSIPSSIVQNIFFFIKKIVKNRMNFLNSACFLSVCHQHIYYQVLHKINIANLRVLNLKLISVFISHKNTWLKLSIMLLLSYSFWKIYLLFSSYYFSIWWITSFLIELLKQSLRIWSCNYILQINQSFKYLTQKKFGQFSSSHDGAQKRHKVVIWPNWIIIDLLLKFGFLKCKTHFSRSFFVVDGNAEFNKCIKNFDFTYNEYKTLVEN